MSDYEFLSITKNKLVLFLVITLSVAFVICLFMISVYACQPKAAVEPASSISQMDKEARVSVNDFLFEEYALYAKESKYYLFREQMKEWSEEQVKKYFTPAEEILRDFYKKENDNTVREMFDTIQ
jgi:hypothetical protein